MAVPASADKMWIVDPSGPVCLVVGWSMVTASSESDGSDRPGSHHDTSCRFAPRPGRARRHARYELAARIAKATSPAPVKLVWSRENEDLSTA